MSESTDFLTIDEAIPGTDKQLRDFIQWQLQVGTLLGTLAEEMANYLYLRESEHLPALARQAIDDAKDLAHRAVEALGKTDVFFCFSEPIYVRLFSLVVPLTGILKGLSEADLGCRESVETAIDEFRAISPRYQTEVKRFTRGCLIVLKRRGEKKKSRDDQPPVSSTGQTPVAEDDDANSPKKPKRSTQKGEGQAKLKAALTKRHKYANGSCLDLTPINSNELARMAEVSRSTANSFFNNWFGSDKEAKDGYPNYKIACHDEHKLIVILKAMNNDHPRPGEVLFGQKAPDAVENPDHRGDRWRKPRASELRHDDDD